MACPESRRAHCIWNRLPPIWRSANSARSAVRIPCSSSFTADSGKRNTICCMPDTLCAALKSAGVATWSLEYRRIGDPGGGWPGTLEDIVHGAEHVNKLVKRFPLNLDHLLAAGHSAGGHLALWLAAQMAVDLRGVISLAGVADLRRAWDLRLSDGIVAKFLGGTPDRVPSRYAAASPIELLPISVKQDVIHGTDDDIVPFEISQRFAKASHNSRT